MPPKCPFPGRDTYGLDGWWTAIDDNGKTCTVRWSGGTKNVNDKGMSGDAIRRRDNKQIRIHMCASATCAARNTKYTKVYGVFPPPEHVRFIAWLPPEEAASAAEEATPPVGGSHVAAGAQGNEIEAAGAEAISEVHNMFPDARSEEKSAVAELSSEFCKSARDGTSPKVQLVIKRRCRSSHSLWDDLRKCT